MTRNFSTVPLAFLQKTQPWTIAYSSPFMSALNQPGTAHLMGAHATLHAMKTVGQLAAVFEAVDHTGSPINAAGRQAIADKAADLVTAAMRLANLYEFDLATAVVTRSEEKNRVKLPAWDKAGGNRNSDWEYV